MSRRTANPHNMELVHGIYDAQAAQHAITKEWPMKLRLNENAHDDLLAYCKISAIHARYGKDRLISFSTMAVTVDSAADPFDIE
jgi:hypothetical protein